MDGGSADHAGSGYLPTAMDGGSADHAGSSYLPPLRATTPVGIASRPARCDFQDCEVVTPYGRFCRERANVTSGIEPGWTSSPTANDRA